MSTVGQIKTEVLANQFSSDRYSTLITEWINEAQQWFIQEVDLPTQRILEATNLDYDFYEQEVPEDFLKVINLNIYGPNEIMGTHLKQMDQSKYIDLPDFQARPEYYIFVGNNLYQVYPQPDNNYHLEFYYYCLPTALTSDSQTPEIPEIFHHILKEYTLVRIYETEHDFSAAQYHKATLDEETLRAKGYIKEREFEGPQQVEGTWSSRV